MSSEYIDIDELDNNLRRARKESGYSCRDVALKIKASTATIYGLELGTIEPITYDGQIKKICLALCELYNISIEEAFPRHFCTISRNEITNDQLIGFHCNTTDPESLLYAKEIISLMPKRKRNRDIFLRRALCGDSFAEISKDIGCTMPRVLQVYRKFSRQCRAILLDAEKKDSL